MKRILAILAVLTAMSLSGCGYNTIQKREQTVKSAWSEVINLYKQREDMVSQLIGTVQGGADHERGTLKEVIEARSKATSIQVTPELANDPAALQKWSKAQGDVSNALSRLMMVSERYPDLKANAQFMMLQGQLAVMEKKITRARSKYITEIQDYNITITTLPTAFTAYFMGKKEKAQFTVDDEKAISKAPTVKFGSPQPAPMRPEPAK